MSLTLALTDSDLGSQIIPLIDKFEAKIKAAEPIFNLDGRKLEEVIRTVPYHQASYDQTLQEVKALEEWLLTLKEKRVAKAWKKFNEGYSRALTTKDIQAYIGGEKDIVEINQILIEIVLIKNNMAAIVESIKQIGWMVSHITKLRVAELEEAIL
jgi:hypothetical protein